MTTAAGDFAIDWSGVGDTDPYTNSNFTAENAAFKVESGALEPKTGTASFFALTGVSHDGGDDFSAKMEINHATGGSNPMAAAILDSSGNGYGVEIHGSNTRIRRYASYATVAFLAFTNVAYSAGDVFSITLDASTGDLEAFKNAVSYSTANDTTYTSGFRPGIQGIILSGPSTEGAVSFAADNLVVGPTVTGPATGTQGTEVVAVVTDGTNITEFSLVSGSFSIEQTNSDTITATEWPYELSSGEDVAVSTGVTTAGIPLKADVVGTSTPYTWVQRVTDGSTPATSAFTPSIETTRQVVQTTISEANTTSGQSMLGTNLIATVENGLQYTMPKVVNGVTLTTLVNGNVIFSDSELDAAGGSITWNSGYFFPSSGEWEKLAVTLTEGGLSVAGVMEDVMAVVMEDVMQSVI